MTQHERIIDYINTWGSITQREAVIELGINYLTTRISELRQDGLKIKGEWEISKNRYGEPVRYIRYSMEEKNG